MGTWFRLMMLTAPCKTDRSSTVKHVNYAFDQVHGPGAAAATESNEGIPGQLNMRRALHVDGTIGRCVCFPNRTLAVLLLQIACWASRYALKSSYTDVGSAPNQERFLLVLEYPDATLLRLVGSLVPGPRTTILVSVVGTMQPA